MKLDNRILLFFALPVLAPLLLPPQVLIEGIEVILFVAALLLTTGYLLYQGRRLALTFMVFLQGLNFIVRMMLFFSRSVDSKGTVDWAFIITSLLSMALSFYLLMRLDAVDIRAQLKD
ncbi:MAG: hypothetical protein OHK0052_14260 [Anaerolineales bacterium]